LILFIFLYALTYVAAHITGPTALQALVKVAQLFRSSDQLSSLSSSWPASAARTVPHLFDWHTLCKKLGAT